ncbi:GntR family transcriptional regulator [Roseivivax isoporae]|uniref:HTH gntR-type domain-containing protein n=1 Tax=Roseivivax isoporae LMG 25204 TaxID=1449351 RepID=X7FD88_9RHOB|nr:GntR family transcriptional regulator [Roseivivax isoporae]ETX30026.1 hypothetical protein RISW2_19770 [Roseivivax isoporae LMG 25204]
MFDPQSPFTPTAPGPEPMQDFAYRRLRDAIMCCDLAPGATLSEGALAARFSLGRAAVRSALARLSESGIIEAAARRGWQVAPVTGAELRRIVAARLRIEPALAHVPLDPEEAALLQGRDALVRRSFDAGDRAAAHAAARQLRDTLAARLDNPFLARALADLWDRGARILALGPASPPVPLAPLFAALARRDAGAAETAIAAQIESFRATATDILLDAARVAPPAPGPRRGNAGRPDHVEPTTDRTDRGDRPCPEHWD